MTVRTAQAIIDNVINTKGLVEAHSAVNQNGTIVLDAGTAGISIGGTVDASGVLDGTAGGAISLTGGIVNIGQPAAVSVPTRTTTLTAGTTATQPNGTTATTTLIAGTTATQPNGTSATTTLIAGTTATQPNGNTATTTPTAGTTATQPNGTSATTTTTATGAQAPATGSTSPPPVVVDASGLTGGGTITIRASGLQFAAGLTPTSTAVVVGSNASLLAGAVQSGDGGIIDIAANSSVSRPLRVTVQGVLNADGGLNGGNGGQIRLTAHDLDLTGLVASAAPRSSTGMAGQFIATAASIAVADQITTAPVTASWVATQPGLLGDPAQMTGLNLYDDEVAQAPIGFTFTYMGVKYNSVDISSNGFLSFSSLNGNSWCCQGQLLNAPGQSSPLNSIFGLWTDVISQNRTTPSYTTQTLADGSKRFIAGWYNTNEFSSGPLNSLEIVLYQNGKIQVNYGNVDITSHAWTVGLTGAIPGDSSLLYSNLLPLTAPAIQTLGNQSFITTAGIGPSVSQLPAALISGLLSGGTNVSLLATVASNGQVSINAPITKSAGGAANLQLVATGDVVVQPGADITAQAGLSVSIQADSLGAGVGVIRLGANIDTGTSVQQPNSLSDGLVATKYDGYFNDNFAYFNTATVISDPIFAAPFTAINTTTPGTNVGYNYSTRYQGYFRPSVSGVYTFQSISDDASYIFLGNAGESATSLLSRITSAAPVVSDSGAHPPVAAQGNTASLTAGVLYPISVLFGQGGGGDYLAVSFAAPGAALSENGLGSYFHGLPATGNVSLRGNVVLTGNAAITSQSGWMCWATSTAPWQVPSVFRFKPRAVRCRSPALSAARRRWRVSLSRAWS